MEMRAAQSGTTAEPGSEFLALALPNADNPTHSAGTLRQAALTTSESIVGALNVSIPGRFLFAGIDGDQQALQAPNDAAAATGMSPMDAMSALVAGNPPTDAASVGDLITSINAAFASDPTANPAHRFEGTFFSGTPALDASGNPSARVNTQIDPSEIGRAHV